MRKSLKDTCPHAVVIGGSIAGLCVAKVLSEHFDRVTIYERDELPDGPVNRGAIPQGQHVHLLMARGAQELEALFPGLLADMAAAGVPVVENHPDAIHFAAAGHVLGTGHTLESRFTAYLPSRGRLEWQIRQRVLALPNVTVHHGAVAHPRFDATTERVTGVVLDDGSLVRADLVVDGSGRGSRLPAWLQEWGYDRPREDTVKIGVTYASHRVRIPKGAMPEQMVLVSASHDEGLGMGMLFHEDGIWTVTAFGVARAQPPRDFTGIRAQATTTLPPHIAAALNAGEPVGEMAFHRYPSARWRRYDKLRRLPGAILPFGDAVASLNPTYGQGVTMTALQATDLRAELAAGRTDFIPRLVHRTARTIYPVWLLNSVADQIAHGAEGDRSWWYAPLYGLFDQFIGAAETDPVLAEWFLRRTSLLDSLYLAPSPRLIARAVRTNVGLWRSARRQPPSQDTEPLSAAG